MTCSKCNKELDEKEFYPSVLKRTRKDSKCRCIECERQVRKDRGYAKKWRDSHKAERNAYAKEYDANNKAAKQFRRYKAHLAIYGLTPADYDRMYSDQQGCCAICGEHQSTQKRRLSVDHCHVTGDVRGLLCCTCNAGIGNLKDCPSLLLSAIEYLEKTS